MLEKILEDYNYDLWGLFMGVLGTALVLFVMMGFIYLFYMGIHWEKRLSEKKLQESYRRSKGKGRHSYRQSSAQGSLISGRNAQDILNQDNHGFHGHRAGGGMVNTDTLEDWARYPDKVNDPYDY